MPRSDPGARVEDYYRRVADSLIQQIRRGTAPWTQAWKPGEKALPSNIKTGKPYRGGNSVWLASTAERRGYSDERWGTYRQVKDIGGQVRRGEKGCAILYWQFEAKRLARDRDGKPVLDDKGQPLHETRALASPRVYQYTVFNAEQCSGLPARAPRAGARSWDKHEGAERVMQESGARFVHAGSNRAFYDLERDRIVLPYREQFPSGPTYYQTALHELGHWTGHESRLNRSTLVKGIEDGPKSPQYAREELRAEISAMMTGDRLNLGHDPSRHASYVGSWIEALRDDPREIYKASKDAQQMSDFLLGRDRDREQGRESALRAFERGVSGSAAEPQARGQRAERLPEGHRAHAPASLPRPARERDRGGAPER